MPLKEAAEVPFFTGFFTQLANSTSTAPNPPPISPVSRELPLFTEFYTKPFNLQRKGKPLAKITIGNHYKFISKFLGECVHACALTHAHLATRVRSCMYARPTQLCPLAPATRVMHA